MKPQTRNFLLLGGAVGVAVAIFEIAFLTLIHFPVLLYGLPKIVVDNVCIAYRNSSAVIQLEPASARFDTGIAYTLRPGRFVFSGIEFKNEYFVNTMGLRDTEDALHKPRVIVLGDSWAMGWGVNQGEVFAKVFEKKSGLKVLNAAISSYGTAREIMMVRRLDTSNLKYLIIQYYENDYWENMLYYLNNNKLPADIIARNYQLAINRYQKQKGYFPGKYTVGFIADKIHKVSAWIVARKNQGKPQKGIIFSNQDSRTRPFCQVKISYDRDIQNFFSMDQSARAFLDKNKGIEYFYIDQDECDLFLNVLLTAGIDFSNIQIITLAWAKEDERFLQALKEKIKKGDYPAYIKGMILLNMASVLPASDLYILDGHPKASAHKVVADAIINVVKSNSYNDFSRP
ncbi:MAG TPA: hypothetical protein PKL77_06520 [Candidatus Omnitrophota bacterium]|nr:hypothetical protein [Candidatus Omnitrophota bacterium]HPT07919.1 hypothetical protein [Candidatus Omnitrophota bacterium]